LTVASPITSFVVSSPTNTNCYLKHRVALGCASLNEPALGISLQKSMFPALFVHSGAVSKTRPLAGQLI
jgi:hypothetical protein